MTNLNIQPGTKVTVHMNLNRQRRGFTDCWSVTVAGKVVGYTDHCTIANATPKIAHGTYRRLIEGGARKVYAKIAGEWCEPQDASGDVIRCNPFRQPEFTRLDGSVYEGSAFATFSIGGGFIAH